MIRHIDIDLADDGSPSGFRLEAIDMAQFLAADEAERDEIASRFDRGLREIGFAVVYNHGIAQSFLDHMIDVTGRLFDLDPAQKLEVASRGSQGQFCGWVSFAADAASRVYGAGDEAPPDLRERYRAVVTEAEEIRERVGPNLWPAAVPEFEPTWREYYGVFERLAMQVMSLGARALGQPEDFFTTYFERHFSVLMSTLSPPITDRAPGQNRCGAHTDTGTLTFVYQPNSRGGVQVQLPDGRWGAPKTTNGDIVVNCADLLALWTNDRWKSTIHRVGGPADRLDERRQSVVFFHQPSLDVTIECLPGCFDEQHPPKYEPVTLREHFDDNQKQLGTKEVPA
ncbi:MAG: 2-oxoglutarate and iron-dependent oxygenase domain-containing protein [Nannocystaceae bacterium]